MKDLNMPMLLRNFYSIICFYWCVLFYLKINYMKNVFWFIFELPILLLKTFFTSVAYSLLIFIPIYAIFNLQIIYLYIIFFILFLLSTYVEIDEYLKNNWF